MKTNNCQKIKLLKLYELLQQQTDEMHPLKTVEIIDKLNEYNITCDRRTLTRDIALLNENGYEVMSCMIRHEKGYYVEDRSFSIPELRILVDAVQASSFITEKKSEDLISKLTALGGSHQAEILRKNIVCFNTRKHSNEKIYYTVDTIINAIDKGKQISFKYYQLNENREKLYKRSERYLMDPIALIFLEDNYYLSCYYKKHNGIANYRVDRMEDVCIENSEICEAAQVQHNSMSDYTTQAFRMFGNEKVDEVTLKFKNELIGTMFDKFGEELNITRIDSETCQATVQVQISPTFWGWIFQFNGRLVLETSEALMNDLSKYLTKFNTIE